MGDELNALIESDDWQRVCRILRKQLVIWGCVLVLVVGLIVARFTMGEHTSYVPIIVAVFIAWRFFKLVRLYVISYHNMKFMNAEEYLSDQPSLDQPLFEGNIHGCAVHFSNDMIQYYVPKPVTDDTMSVAEEHMGYCEDTVLQGDNLTTLAATIKESTVWTFWWD